MMIRLWFGIAMALAVSASSQVEEVEIEGCGNAMALTKPLAKLEESNFKELSLDRIQAMWPTKLEASECTADGCRSVLHQGRIIDGQCQCCEKIDIDRSTNSAGGVDESLVVTMYYSARGKKKMVAAAKALAKAAGLADEEVTTVGRESEKSFQWKGTRQAEMFLMSVKLSHREKLWTAYVHIERHLLGSAAAPAFW
jgi:hypothetical protein